MTSRNDRIKGVMLGQAVADALGVHYELGIPSHGNAQMLGGGYGFKPGEWSDDTQQAICVLRGRSVPNEVAMELIKWYRGKPADVGPTTGRTLARADRTVASVHTAATAMTEASKQAGKGREPGWASNGSLMRTSPLALAFQAEHQAISYAGRGNVTERIAFTARQVSDLTHYDPMAGDACVLWSCAIDQAIEKGAKFEVRSGIYAGMKFIPAERQEKWHDIIRDALDGMPPTSNLNVVKAFRAALWAVAHSHDYEGTVQAAINIGGDTDTVAAIAGGLAGAMYGAATIPSEWVKVLHGWPGMRAADLEQMALDAAGVS